MDQYETLYKYCSYSLEQIMEYPDYKKICQMFLSLARDKEMKEKLESVLYEGGYQDFSISSRLCNKDNPSIEMCRRISMAYFIIRNPETFDVMAKNKVCLFHGTNGNALPNILKYGLNSAVESTNNNIPVNTGESWSREFQSRDFISLTDALHVSEYYAGMGAKNGDDLLNFEVILGTTFDDVFDNHCIVHSDVLEVGVRSNLPLENIKMIMVPSDKLSFVRKIVGDEILVMPLDDINNKFFYINDHYGFEILEEKYRQFAQDIKKENRRFRRNEIKELVLGRTLKKVRASLKSFDRWLNGEEVQSNDLRFRY